MHTVNMWDAQFTVQISNQNKQSCEFLLELQELCKSKLCSVLDYEKGLLIQRPWILYNVKKAARTNL